AASLRERAQFRIVADESVQPAPDLELALDRGAQPRLPFVGQSAAQGRNADQDRGRALPLRDATLKIPDDRNLAAESEHILRGLPGLLAIEDRHDAVGEVANAGVGGLGGEWT